jgi:hypothetical protein
MIRSPSPSQRGPMPRPRQRRRVWIETPSSSATCRGRMHRMPPNNIALSRSITHFTGRMRLARAPRAEARMPAGVRRAPGSGIGPGGPREKNFSYAESCCCSGTPGRTVLPVFVALAPSLGDSLLFSLCSRASMVGCRTAAREIEPSSSPVRCIACASTSWTPGARACACGRCVHYRLELMAGRLAGVTIAPSSTTASARARSK